MINTKAHVKEKIFPVNTSLLSNQLIERLPSNEQKYLQRYSRPVELVVGTTLYAKNQPIENVYFPTDGFVSQATSNDGTVALELGFVGYEGMLGASLLLGEKTAPITATVLGAGSAIAMSSSQFGRALYQNEKLLRALQHYLFGMIQQWAQSAFCGHFHQTTPRLAGLLLMAHDRAHRSTFTITQDSLAKLLGVRRSSVTVAASELQRKKRIYYQRGEIDIIDRPGLEAIACTCYAYTPDS